MEWITQHVLEKYNFWIAMLIIIIGLTATVVKENLVKKLIGLSIFQTAFFLWVVSLGDVGRNILTTWGLKTQTPPILWTRSRRERIHLCQSPASCAHADGDCGKRSNNCSRACNRDKNISKIRDHRRR